MNNKWLMTLYLAIVFSCSIASASDESAESLDLPVNLNVVQSLDITGTVNKMSGTPQRVVVDFEVPLSVGEKPLQVKRTYASYIFPEGSEYSNYHTASWRFEFFYVMLSEKSVSHGTQGYMIVQLPDGQDEVFVKKPNHVNYYSLTSKSWISRKSDDKSVLTLEDGTQVHFAKRSSGHGYENLRRLLGNHDYYAVSKIVDVKGLETIVESNGLLGPNKITDASGRWIKFHWSGENLDKVTSSAGQEVIYKSKSIRESYQNGVYYSSVINEATYKDGTKAYYNFDNYNLLNKVVDSRQEGNKINVRYAYTTERLGPGGRFISRITSIQNALSDEKLSSIYARKTESSVLYEELLPNGVTRGFKVLPKEKLIYSNSGPRSIETYHGMSYIDSYDNTWYTGMKQFGITRVMNHISHPNKSTILVLYPQLYTSVQTEPIRVEGYKLRDGNTIEFEYTDNKAPYYLKSRTDERGHKTTYTYWNGKLPRKTTYPDGTWEEWSDYDTYAQPKKHVLQNGAIEYWEYDSKGRLVRHWLPSFDGKKHAVTYTYYPDGHAWEDRLKTETDPNGNTTTYEYEYYNGSPISDRGLVTKETYADGSFKEFTYNAYGSVLSEKNEKGEKTTYKYDEYQRLLEEKNPLNQTTKWDYKHDDKGALAYVQDNPAKRILPSGKVTKYQYDKKFRLHKRTEAYGTSEAGTYEYSYNAEDSLTSKSDPSGHSVSYEYDYRNRLKTKKERYLQGSTFKYKVAQYERDEASNIIKVTQPDQSVTTYTYDKMNRKESFTNELKETTRYTYSKLGQLEQTIDPQGRKTGTHYDAQGRILLKTAPGKNEKPVLSEAYWYDGAGNVIKKMDARDVWTAYTYDKRNRETYRCYSDGTPAVTSEYDVAGRLTKTFNSYKSVAFTYDGAGQTKSATHNFSNGPTQVVQYQYDSDGNRTELKALPHLNLKYEYNEQNRVKKIQNHGSNVVDYTYWKNGRVRTKKLGNNKTATLSYDDGIYLSQVSESGVQNRKYSYDLRNRITEFEDSEYSEEYTYNAHSQLTNMNRTKNFGSTDYRNFDYDASDNFNSKNELNSLNYTNNSANQNTSVSGGLSVSNTFDAFGNRTHKGSWTYQFNADGKMTKAQNGSKSYSFHFGPDGKVASLEMDSEQYFSVYDGLNEVLRLNQNGSLNHSVIWGAGLKEPVQFKKSNGTYYLHLNHLNSVIAVSNTSGTVLERYVYEPYGTFNSYSNGWSSRSSSSVKSPVMFTGHRWIPEIGLYDAGARFYDAELGLWTSPDADRQYHSLYSYAGGDPINKIDPDGNNAIAKLLLKKAIEAAKKLFKSKKSNKNSKVGNSKKGQKASQTKSSETKTETKTVDDLKKESTPGKKTKGRSQNHDKEGGVDQANKDFDSLSPKNQKDIGKGGRTGELPDGSQVNVRPGSTDGRPTLEVQKGKSRTKFRYNE